MTIFKPHWRDDLTNEQYHADREFTSSSTLKLAVTETPLDYRHVSLNGSGIKSTKEMQLSTLAHHIVLEGEDFIKRYVVKPDFDRRTKVGKADAELWESENKGKLAVTQDDLHALEGMYEGLHRNVEAVTILKGSLFERSGYYRAPTGLLCRIRYDCYDPNMGLLADLKALRDVSYKTFQKELLNRRWDFSLAMYGQGIAAIDGNEPDDYAFIGLLKTPPYHCVVYPVKQDLMIRAQDDYKAALAIVAECEKTNIWPGLPDNMKRIGFPDWYERQLENEQRDQAGHDFT